MKSTTLVSAALLALAQVFEVSAGTPTINHIHPVKRQGTSTEHLQLPSQSPVVGALRSQGCFRSSGNLTIHVLIRDVGNTSGVCFDTCKADYAVSATRGSDCYCGNAYPPEDSMAEDEECSQACPGFDPEACGNISPRAWSVYNTGVLDVTFEDPPPVSSSTTSAPTTSATNPASNPPQQSTTSAPSDGAGDEDENNDGGSDGPNVVAIVAGIVGGVVAIAALAGGFWFFLRRRRNAEIEEEHRRNAAVNAFISGAKPPSSSGNISLTDSRLEPGLGTRRMSDGSIADNQDYSRKILRVTNA